MTNVADADLVREVFHYDPETGLFRWRVSFSNRVRVGDIAGTIRPDGRRLLRFDGRLVLASRLAFLYMSGRWPKDQMDHADMDPSNDRWSNLREANNSQNNANRRFHTSRFKGVRFFKKCNRWAAYIRGDNCQRHLGMFSSEEEAARAYDAAAMERYGEFARLNFP